MIEAQVLTKRYGAKTAVDEASFMVRPGKVTGLLGPNGAGKSTTMRMIVGLDRPTAGSVTVNGLAYAQHGAPLHQVGALLEAKGVHTGRSAYNHLLALGATHGIGASRVREVIQIAGLESVARKRVGGFSLGMGQRLGIAAALLGDPQTLILDEPVNGLDPEGVLWVRTLVRHLASEGRTVLLSSHLMSEMALTADHIIVFGRGRVIADTPIGEFVDQGRAATVRVSSPRADEFARLLQSPNVQVNRVDAVTLDVVGVTAESIGELAASAGIALHGINTISGSLEDAYLKLTAEEVEYKSGMTGTSDATIQQEAKR